MQRVGTRVERLMRITLISIHNRTRARQSGAWLQMGLMRRMGLMSCISLMSPIGPIPFYGRRVELSVAGVRTHQDLNARHPKALTSQTPKEA